MAIVFSKQKKRQNIMIVIFAAIVVITVFILWQGFFREESFFFDEESFVVPAKDIDIDFGVFEQARKFKPFTEISPLEEESGRENPFLPYY